VRVFLQTACRWSQPFADCRHRLHVNIFDKAAQQFTLPSGYFDLPKVESLSSPAQAELQFNYEPSPFAFWITRRSDPGSAPIFDTRLTSLPSTPIPAFRDSTSDPSLEFDGFSLVFEDRYLQVRAHYVYRSSRIT
jgi:alpha-glucosidase